MMDFALNTMDFVLKNDDFDSTNEGLDLVGTHKVLEALGETPPTWRVIDAARFAKKHKEEGDADQVIFTEEAKTLMNWDLSSIARHAMALGIDADYIGDVMRSSPSYSYGTVDEPVSF